MNIMENYNLDTGKKYVKDLFSPECFYSIPEYQRPYVWGTEQVTKLLSDLTEAMTRNEKKEYYLGTMIWNTKQVKDAHLSYTYQDILDGQQRFITLFLLHGVIRDLAKDTRLKEKVSKRLKQEEDIYDGVPERHRIVFEIREDKDFLDEYLLTAGGTNKVDELQKIKISKTHSKAVRNMAHSILVMRKWWGNKTTTLGDIKFQEFIQKFFQYLSSKVLVLSLATYNNLMDAYSLFRVTNSRGSQLEASDILKAHTLEVIIDKHTRLSSAKEWERFGDIVEAPFTNFDEFLWSLVFIQMKYKNDDNQNLPKAFDFLWNKGTLKKGVPTFKFIEKYVKHYEAITSGSIFTKETGVFFSNLVSIQQNSQFMTPLMYYRECFGDYRILDFFIKLDNLFSVAWLSGKRISSTRMFLLLKKIQEFKNAVDVESEISMIRDSETENLRLKGFVKVVGLENSADNFLNSECLKYDYVNEGYSQETDINSFFDTLATENWGNYSGSKINKTRYLLLKLDLILGNHNTTMVFNKKNSTVEHLIPRTVENTDWEIDTEEHKHWLHKLGNLVLIDQRINSSMRNNTYDVKRTKYQGAIEARANTNWVFMQNESWGVASVESNQKRVIELLKEYYLGNSVETLSKIKKNLGK